MANILERTTTEEYDEDGRLTSRTTVEKYAPEDKPNLYGVPSDFAEAMIEPHELWKACKRAARDYGIRVKTANT